MTRDDRDECDCGEGNLPHWAVVINTTGGSTTLRMPALDADHALRSIFQKNSTGQPVFSCGREPGTALGVVPGPGNAVSVEGPWEDYLEALKMLKINEHSVLELALRDEQRRDPPRRLVHQAIYQRMGQLKQQQHRSAQLVNLGARNGPGPHR